MRTILDDLADHARERVRLAKESVPISSLMETALTLPRGDFPFERALGSPGISFICEVKRASPSKGMIAEDFPYLEIAKDYEAAGADAISVLTEPKWFLGSGRYLEEISNSVAIPTLRKDFTVDPYMLYEAKILGASAVLLIVSLLDEADLRAYIEICDSLGLSALVEVHDESEAETAVSAGARIIGVNNRNLKDFSVDLGNAARLRKRVPKHILFVSESGMRDPADVRAAAEIGANAVLIGEALMRSEDRKAFLHNLREGII